MDEPQLIPLYIDTQSMFDEFCKSLSGSPVLAIDTEFERRTTYYPRPALVQLADDSRAVLIDPLAVDDWQSFADLFNSDTCFVMHSCSEDLEVFRRLVGVLPNHLFDTQIACAFIGLGEALGYANMVETLCSVVLDKSETRSDWLQRPLTERQQDYAREDVRWLLPIHAELSKRLNAKERLTWVEQECTQLLNRYRMENPTSAQWLRLKGLNRADVSDWPLLFGLSQWRENIARKLDKPRSWIMKDPELLEIARRKPKNRPQLASLAEASPVTLRRNSADVLSITNTEVLPAPEQLPMPNLEPDAKVLLKRAQRLINEKAESLSLASRFIANKQDLSRYILNRTGKSEEPSVLDQGWRQELVGEQLQQLMVER